MESMKCKKKNQFFWGRDTPHTKYSHFYYIHLLRFVFCPCVDFKAKLICGAGDGEQAVGDGERHRSGGSGELVKGSESLFRDLLDTFGGKH